LYRGSAEDLLDRHYQAAKAFRADIIVRVTSDCPLVDPGVIDQCVRKLIEEKCDLASNFTADASTFPRGLDVRVFTFDALSKAHENATESYEREHVVPYIWENKNGEFTICPAVVVTTTI